MRLVVTSPPLLGDLDHSWFTHMPVLEKAAHHRLVRQLYVDASIPAHDVGAKSMAAVDVLLCVVPDSEV